MLLLVVIVIAAGMIGWLKISKNRGNASTVTIAHMYSNSINFVFQLLMTAILQLQANQSQGTLKDRAVPPNKESEVYYSDVKRSTAKTTFSMESNIAYATTTTTTTDDTAAKHEANYTEPQYYI